tara:strand:+ start:3551 stop:3829 length:279 start_codon:yes stop_codon:yes gene_type:complete
MGALTKLIQRPEIMDKLKAIGQKNRQAMFGAGQKPEDYEQGPTMSQSMGVKAMGVASPNMKDQYNRYLVEEKERKKRQSSESINSAGQSLLS